MNFIKIPNSFIWQTDSNTIIDKNTLYTLIYISFSKNKMNLCTFSIKSLIEYIGISVDRHKGKSLDIFKQSLDILQDNEIILYDTRISKSKISDCISCSLNISFNKNDQNEDINFFKIEFNDFKKIVDCNKNNKIEVLYTYCYMLSRCGNRKSELCDMTINGGKGNYFFEDYDTICKELNLSRTAFFNIITELQELNLIYFNNIGTIKKNKNVIVSNNVYAKDLLSLEEGLKCSNSYWEQKGYEVISNNSNELKNKIKGYKGRISQLKKENKSTKRLENKLKKYEKELENLKKLNIKKTVDKIN